MSRQVPKWKMKCSLPRCRGKGAHVRKGSVSLHWRGEGLRSVGPPNPVNLRKKQVFALICGGDCIFLIEIYKSPHI